MATQLGLYNAALTHLGEAQLTSLADNIESRRVLDLYYSNALLELLVLGYWKFAIRSVRITADPLITPAFGYKNSFSMPLDNVRVFDVSASESFFPPLTDWIEESGGWFAHPDPIYVRYISNDPAYGLSLTRFPPRYTTCLEWMLAKKAAARLTQGDTKIKNADTEFSRTLGIALAFDAMLEPPKQLPNGTWTTGRYMNRRSWDRNPARV